MVNSNLNILSGTGQANLQLAVRNGSPIAIDAALKKGANPNFLNKFQRTPLHMLVMRNSIIDAAIQVLLDDKRTDPNIPGKNGNTPLHVAAEKSSEQAIKILVADLGTNLQVRNSENHSPLDLIRNKFHSQDATSTEKDCLKKCFRLIEREMSARQQGPIAFARNKHSDEKNIGTLSHDLVSLVSTFCLPSIPPIEVPPDQMDAWLRGE